MASFERTSSQTEVEERKFQKFPIRRLEPSIQKFLKVIQIDLQRLHRHRQNIEKFIRLQDATSLNTEQINATRTVQQIKANLGEIEKSRLQVLDEDLENFDSKISDMRQAALESVLEFVDISKPDSTVEDEKKSPSLQHPPTHDVESVRSHNHDLVVGSLPSDNSSSHLLVQTQIEMVDNAQSAEVTESWESLYENLQELNTMIHDFATVVQRQQEGIDRIEDNVEHAHASVQEGTFQLSKAAKYKAMMIPVAGAVIGTVVGGPIGLVAGAKIGGLCALGGGGVGFLGGRFVKKRQDKITEVELTNLSVRRSLSEPDVANAEGKESREWFGWLPWKQTSETDPLVDAKQSAEPIT